MFRFLDLLIASPGRLRNASKERPVNLKLLPLIALLSLTACQDLKGMHDQMRNHLHGGPHHGGSPAPGQAGFNMQGNDQAEFFANPNTHAFYDLSVKTFANGADKIDFPAYQQQSYAIFRALGASRGVPPQAMQDHLKDIPAQMVQIVKDDPTALKDYQSFITAMVGPE